MLTLLAGTDAAGLKAAAQSVSPASPSPTGQRRVRVVNGGAVEMKVRRLPEGVDLVIEGVGAAPQLQQTTRGSTWEGRLLTSGPTTLRLGPQRLSLPEAGLQSISIDGGGTEYRLLVTPSPGFPLARPLVSADGRNLILSFNAPAQTSLQTLSPNLTTPGRVSQPTYVPPLQPRAVAPPVGDMAVGTMMIRNNSFVQISGPRVTLTMRDAPAKAALMALARIGGYGFAFLDEKEPDKSTFLTVGSGSSRESKSELMQGAGARPVNLSFVNESFQTALNSALLSAGLQAKLEGNVLFVGLTANSKSFGPQLSKVYRLNQASANSAADYLASLGASMQKVSTTTTTTTDFATNQSNPASGAGTPNATSGQQTIQQQTIPQAQSYGSGVGPLLGLIGTTDTRLGTITLVGDPRLVAIAETYLRQIDLRQRQVALAVKILDLNLENAKEIANSFSFRWGNNILVSDNGQMISAFGRNLPPGAATSFDGASANAFQFPRFFAENGAPPNPSLQYPRDNFMNFIRAQIEARNAKIVASPTLILQENASQLRSADSGGSSGGGGDDTGGLDQYTIDSPIGRRRANEAAVRVGTNVITNVTVTETEGGGTQCQLELSTAGLVLGARIEKIDDNGFVTFSLSPSISAVTDEIPGPPACTSRISVLSVRRLDTGAARVRDGQTLILTGVISDVDTSEVTKWPILGDLPLVGQFFRANRDVREKRELVIMVTPRIINDEQGGTFGYGFQSGSTETRQFMSQPGL